LKKGNRIFEEKKVDKPGRVYLTGKFEREKKGGGEARGKGGR